MRAVALAVIVAFLAIQTGCFPQNPRARMYSKFAEGGLLGTGIIMEALTNAGADCMVSMPGEPDSGCKNSASLYSSLGVVLILAGLVGFIATISTTPDDDNKPHQVIKAPMVQPDRAPLQVTPVAPTPPPADPTPAPAPAPVMPAAAGSAT